MSSLAANPAGLPCLCLRALMKVRRRLLTGNGNVQLRPYCAVLCVSMLGVKPVNFLRRVSNNDYGRDLPAVCIPSLVRSLLRGTTGALRQLALLLRSYHPKHATIACRGTPVLRRPAGYGFPRNLIRKCTEKICPDPP
jgi:hypothetical protein